jgi:predicted transcriptional regulator
MGKSKTHAIYDFIREREICTVDDLCSNFPDIKRSTIRGRLSDLRKANYIFKTPTNSHGIVDPQKEYVTSHWSYKDGK